MTTAEKESRERLEAVMANAPDHILTLERSGRITYINRVLGNIRADEIVGRMATDFSLPEYAETLRQAIEQVFANGQPQEIELQGIGDEGPPAWYVARLAPIRHGDQIESLVLIATDVTARKQMEAGLRESEERYRSLVEMAADAIVVIQAGNVVYANPAAVKMAGFASEREMQGFSVLSILRPEDLPIATGRQQMILETGQTTKPRHYPFVHADGRKLDVEACGSLCQFQGRPAIQAICRDITDRLRDERAVRRSETLLRAIFDNEPECVKLVSADGSLLDMNAAGLAMIEADSREQVIGKSVFDLVATEHRDAFRSMTERVCQGIPDELEFDIIGLRGSRRTMSMRAVPLQYEPTGSTVQLSITRDVTDQKRLQEQVQQGQKMEAVGRLAGGIAHDFNNMLTVILSYCDLLRDSRSSDHKLCAVVDEMVQVADRSANLTKQLLAFSRKQVLRPEILDVDDVVVALHALLQRLIGEDIELLIAPATAICRVRADRTQLEQVLVNIGINARDAMPRGGRLTIRNSAIGIDQVQIEISDTGCGMDDDLRSHIFEPFFTTKSVGKGTGLGLAIVYGIIQQSGGSIGVESAVGQGTTFRILLPAVHEAAAAAALRSIGSQAARHGCETVLVVEDDGLLRKLICDALRARSYTVLAACNGVEALQISARHPGPIDLLVSDVVMPQMGGCELADRLQAIRPHTKVLFISGYTDDPLIHAGLAGPGLAFLQKPFAPDALTRRVRELLDAPVAVG